MNLKNYTTTVPASRSIEYIEKLLAEAGATRIMKEYSSGSCSFISFAIDVNGMTMPFQLPGKVMECYLWMKNKRRNSNDKLLLAQAERIVWKQMHEWVFLQLSLIELGQMEKLEAFFPYLYDMNNQKTFYNRVKEGGYKALLPDAHK